MSVAMEQAGELPALTTSGALLEALRDLDVRRVAVVTPYTKSVTDSLEEFLGEAGIAVTGRSYLGLTREIWRVPYRDVVEMARDAVADGPDALFISCTNLPTYDVIPQLEAELRMPVLSANQVTVWAALKRIGKEAVGPYQALLDPVARRGPAAMTPSPTEPLGADDPPIPPLPGLEQPGAHPAPEQPDRGGPAAPEAALASAGTDLPEPEGLEGPGGSGPDERGGGQPPL